MSRTRAAGGSATVLRANARHLPLADNTVDAVVTSPPYFALRSYQDAGVHYTGQVGDEPTPAAFVASLLDVTRECVRVLKPSGSLWVNLGDKYATAPAGNKVAQGIAAQRPNWAGAFEAQRGDRAKFNFCVPNKSLTGIPWRYALACIDDLGLILRAEVIWSKPNGLPESVTDRVRRSHEVWFHFVTQPRYFSAVDEIRESHKPGQHPAALSFNRVGRGTAPEQSVAPHRIGRDDQGLNALGKLPGSVWTVATEPLTVPDHLGVDHFAAFPTEFPRRIIAGWSPAGVCTACGEGRRPVGDSSEKYLHRPGGATRLGSSYDAADGPRGARHDVGNVRTVHRITGYACACPAPTIEQTIEERDEVTFERVTRTVRVPDPAWVNPAPTTPAVILDPFGGTGTTALVAKALGRHGITIDMSADYSRLAAWRTNNPDQLAKAARIVRSDAARAADHLAIDTLFDLDGGAA